MAKKPKRFQTSVRFADRGEHVWLTKASKADSFDSMNQWLAWLARERAKVVLGPRPEK